MRYKVRFICEKGIVDIGRYDNALIIDADFIEISDKSISFYEDGEIDIMDRCKKIIATFPIESTLVTKEV